MNVIDVTREIVFIADSMFPVAPLPNAFVAFCDIAWRAHRSDRQTARKLAFDEAPAEREIPIAGWQRPNRVEMVR
jgi:hypothetical protein